MHGALLTAARKLSALDAPPRPPAANTRSGSVQSRPGTRTSARPLRSQLRGDLEKAGLANITATYINLLGFVAPDFYEPSLLAI